MYTSMYKIWQICYWVFYLSFSKQWKHYHKSTNHLTIILLSYRTSWLKRLKTWICRIILAITTRNNLHVSIVFLWFLGLNHHRNYSSVHRIWWKTRKTCENHEPENELANDMENVWRREKSKQQNNRCTMRALISRLWILLQSWLYR